jgi:hypothetical protein
MVYKKCAKRQNTSVQIRIQSNPNPNPCNPLCCQSPAENYPKEKTPKIVQSIHMVGAMPCTKQTVDASVSKDSAYEDDPLVPGTAP